MRLGFAAVVVTLASLAALTHPVNQIEVAIYQEIGHLPHWSLPVARDLVWVGSLVAIAGTTAVALLAKRIRLAVTLVLAATLAWGLSQVLSGFVSPRTVVQLHHVPFPFPAEQLAVAGALATVATPYLPRALRLAPWAIVALAALATVAAGQHLPLDALTGAFLGWWAGTLLHLLAGVPGSQTSARGIQRALGRAGLCPVEVACASRRLLAPIRFEVRLGDGSLLDAEVIRRGRRRAGWSYRARRFLASFEVEDDPRLTSPIHEAEHEALVTMVAERAGVRTPGVVLAQELGHGPALVVRRRIDGRRLSDLAGDPDGRRLSHLAGSDPDHRRRPGPGGERPAEPGWNELDPVLLRRVWEQADRLAQARIAHHDLRAANVMVDADRQPWILDFAFARTGADDAHLMQDLAELLVSLASVAGITATLDSAMAVIGPERLGQALPYLQTFALPGRIRNQIVHGSQIVRGDVLLGLRESLAERLDCRPPAFRSRIRPLTVVYLAVCGLAVYLLLPQVGAVPALLHAVARADYRWLVLAAVATAFTFPMAAAGYIGAVRRDLPFWRTTSTQLASAFTSRMTPGGVGGMGLNLIYLERQGVRRDEAIGSIALNQTAGAVVHGAAFFAAVAGLGATGVIGGVRLPGLWVILLVVVGVLVAAGVFLGTPFGRRRVLRPGFRVSKDLLTVLRRPARALALFGGSAGVTLGNGLALAACLAAFDPHFHLLTVLAVYIGGSAIASPAPTPGNLGAVEAALVAGLTGIGVAATPAVAGVLTFRLLTFWIPILPGLGMFRWLQHTGTV